jgi:DNA-binding response OmpR family regulator
MQNSDVAGCRVLVVEDETLIAVLIEDILAEMGCEIVGPIGKLDAALQTAKDGAFDIAILDVTIRGGKVYPVA